MRIKTKLITALMTLSFIGFTLVTAQAAEVKWPKKMTIVCAASGTTVHTITTAIARCIEKNTPVERVIVQPMGGPAVWAPMMEKGELDLAVHNGPDTMTLIQGIDAYAEMGPKTFIRSLVGGSNYSFLFHTTPKTGIQKLSDLKGHVVYTRQAGNPMYESMLKAYLRAAGIAETDLKASMTMPNVREATSDLIEGRAHAFLYPAVPSAVMEINQSADECVFLSPSDEEAKIIISNLPEGFFLRTIPANSEQIRNMKEIRNAPSFRNAIYARADMDSEIAYGIVKAIIDNRESWANVHPQAKAWGTLYSGAPAYHEGAVRYYKEKGLWNEEINEKHEEHLKLLQSSEKK